MSKITNIILCGGSGTRLWPISRMLFPKQFIKFFNNKSLFQMTIERNLKVCNKSMVVANSEHYFLVNDQSDEIGFKIKDYVIEPVGRNTAAAIALSCFCLDKNDLVFVTPSDHLIKNQFEYENAIESAKKFAEEDNLVMFGIKPKFAHTGFGYIQSIDGLIMSFYEKPDALTASKFLEQGNYYWNSGMFMFKAGVFLNELKKYSPEIFNACLVAFENAYSVDFLRIKLDDMLNIPENSIDYAVMEKSSISRMVYCDDIDWSDLGSFDCLYDELPKDDNQNTLTKDHICIDSHRNLIYSCGRLVTTVDIDDFIIVDTPDALLVGKKGSSQKIKNIVDNLKNHGSELHKSHLTAYRPWGKYTVLESSSGYKIKKIEVAPSKRLSLQKHFHRSEHWVVVSGTATVYVGGEVRLVKPNESTYIKIGEVHRLENNGKIPVVLIEVQVGEYTGEDDIIRIEDDYNREGI